MSARIFTNGRIFTAAPGCDGKLEEAMVTAGDKVVFVGSAAEAADVASKHGKADEIDLDGRVVLPGLVDAHTHLMLMGGSLTKAYCLGKNISEIQALMLEERAKNPEAKMLLGCQMQYDALGEWPHKKYLDEVVPDIPVFIEDSSLHSCWLNSKAIEAVGVTKDTPNPKGGEFVRDADGELTGWFKETAVIEYTFPYVAGALTSEQRAEYLDKVFEAYLATGVTGAVDLATTEDDLNAFEAYARKNGNKLPIRVACHWLTRPNGDDESRAEQVRTAAAHRDRIKDLAPWLSVAGIKVVSDGVVDSCTAYLKEPYPTGETPGPIWPADELSKVVALADSLDLQVAVHAIGDAAVDQALDAFEYAIAQNGDRPQRRHRIEHLEVVTNDSIQRLARLGVVASMQPVHADPVKVVNWCDKLAHDHRCDRMFPWREFFECGAEVAFGSDAPTAPYHTMPNLYTATTHMSAIDPELPAPTEERWQNLSKLCLSLDQSIRYYSLGSAYSMRADKAVGTLEPGKAADFSVLSIDPFRDGLDTLRKAQAAISETWVSGELAWKKQ